MPFGEKNKESIPIDRVRSMASAGMSEKDIIRQLKEEGYSFNDIEKALMEVVKEGVSAQPAPPPTPVQPQESTYAPPPASEIPTSPLPQVAQEYTPQPQYPTYTPAYTQPILPAAQERPEAIVEELVESIADEKFEKFSSDTKMLKDDIEKIKADLKSISAQVAAKPAPELPKDLSDKLEDLEVRVGGLERAFRQLLPSMTENIETLAKIVGELTSEAKK